MEDIVKQSLLFDFYGELLTEHQQEIYKEVLFNDMSLGEVALNQGISRQGVHDLVKRCDRILAGYEEKLQLVSKFQQTRILGEEIRRLTGDFVKTRDMELIHRIEQISGDIMEL